MGDIFEQLELEVSSSIHIDRPVHSGGPVYPELGLIIHSRSSAEWESSMAISESLRLTSSRDILVDMARGRGPEQAFMTLGYAGWTAGQLEHEIQHNAWLTVPADHAILFTAQIKDKWRLAAQLLGIDMNHFSSQVGHA